MMLSKVSMVLIFRFVDFEYTHHTHKHLFLALENHVQPCAGSGSTVLRPQLLHRLISPRLTFRTISHGSGIGFNVYCWTCSLFSQLEASTNKTCSCCSLTISGWKSQNKYSGNDIECFPLWLHQRTTSSSAYQTKDVTITAGHQNILSGF